jgi:hypothetical protein
MLQRRVLTVFLSSFRTGTFVNPSPGINFLPAPLISIMMDQEIVESSETSVDGAAKKKSTIFQTLFSLACSATDEGICLHPFDVCVELDSPSSLPQLVSVDALYFKSPIEPANDCNGMNGNHAAPDSKRRRLDVNGTLPSPRGIRDLIEEVEELSALLIELLSGAEE